MQDIQDTTKRLDVPLVFTRFRGDGWQFYLEKPGLALATALLIAATLRAAGGLESRIAIGLGDATFTSTPKSPAMPDLGAASGLAFTASGRALDAMPKNRWLALAGEGVDKLHERLISFIDMRITKWSREQTEVLKVALGPRADVTQEWMANQLGITRQAVAARLSAADFIQINAAAGDFLSHFGGEWPTDD